jgi:hypothetical protein
MNQLQSLHIDLADNLIGDQGAARLSYLFGQRNHDGTMVSQRRGYRYQCDDFKMLRLDLTNNGIGDDGVKALRLNLSAGTKLSNLSLDLGGNLFGSEGVESLREWMATNTRLQTSYATNLIHTAHLRTLIINL